MYRTMTSRRAFMNVASVGALGGVLTGRAGLSENTAQAGALKDEGEKLKRKVEHADDKHDRAFAGVTNAAVKESRHAVSNWKMLH